MRDYPDIAEKIKQKVWINSNIIYFLTVNFFICRRTVLPCKMHSSYRSSVYSWDSLDVVCMYSDFFSYRALFYSYFLQKHVKSRVVALISHVVAFVVGVTDHVQNCCTHLALITH